jgi:uncharacterized membrane protein HdeD (DUF308 family)
MSTAVSSQAIERRTRRKWFLALGTVLVVLGLGGLSLAALLQLTSLLIFGPILLIGSLMQLLTAFFTETGKEKLFHFAAAGLELVLGVFLMVNPPQSVGGVIVLVAVFLIAIGVVRLTRALATQSRSRAWAVMAGVMALLLGVAVWLGSPELWIIGLCIALDFVFNGITWSAIALAEARNEPPAPTADGAAHA